MTSSDAFPKKLDDVTGNRPAIREITDAVMSAKHRQVAAPHMLFTGPPGTGKTSLSRLVSQEMGSRFVYLMGPSISRKQNVSLTLLNLDENDILMIDEIHALDRQAAETFYDAMLNFQLSVVSDDASITTIPLKPFTMIGATTSPGMISPALRQRFRQIRMTLYTPDELMTILSSYASYKGIGIDMDSIATIAMRSRGTPRIACGFLDRSLDLALSRHGRDWISMSDVLVMFEESGIRDDGCGPDDILYLDTLKNSFNGGPAGISSIASVMGMDQKHVRDEIEPWLVSLGLIERKPRGRVLSGDIS